MAPKIEGNPSEPLTIASDVCKGATRVSDALSSAFRNLIDELNGQSSRPTDISRLLGVNKNLAHRVCTSLNKSEPLAALLAMPGPGPLKRLVDRASGHGASAKTCLEARRAIYEFDELIRSVAGDRTSFDSIISSWVPEVRSQVDTAARQSVYRGMRQLLGVFAETKFNICAFKRSETRPGRVDLLDLDGQMGVRRIQASGRLRLTIVSNNTGNSKGSPTSRTVLSEFCSSPPPNSKITGSGESATFEIEWAQKVGNASAQNIVVREFREGAYLLERPAPTEVNTGIVDCLSVPARRFFSDVLFHRDVYPGSVPTFRVFTTGMKGIVPANDHSQEHEQIKIDAEVQAIPEGRVAEMLTPEVPFYRRMLESQISSLGWRIEEFRAFRIKFDYPIFDSQLQWIFPLPEKSK
ncbi:MAG: hypothetical protein RBS39_13665 [Phycisphaerales bacterium]|jgi:hypothetical protein|nr:hypothetical protein [Phycisphaerales bacterium]